jgi:hypothetical protein
LLNPVSLDGTAYSATLRKPPVVRLNVSRASWLADPLKLLRALESNVGSLEVFLSAHTQKGGEGVAAVKQRSERCKIGWKCSMYFRQNQPSSVGDFSTNDPFHLPLDQITMSTRLFSEESLR